MNEGLETKIVSVAFGIGAGLTTGEIIMALMGALAVGVIQPFFRLLFMNTIFKKSKKKTVRRRKRRKLKR